MIKYKLTNLQENILRFLFMQVGKSFNARRLAQQLDVSSPAISKSLLGLKKENFVSIKKDKESKQLRITLNRKNPLIIGLKRAENLRLIYESGLDMYLEEKFPGSTIVLFGSYSTGNDYYNSDIDFAIIGSKSKDVDFRKFEKLLEKEIRVNVYKSWKGINKNLKSNILNGVVLEGGVEI